VKIEQSSDLKLTKVRAERILVEPTLHRASNALLFHPYLPPNGVKENTHSRVRGRDNGLLLKITRLQRCLP
jgi:hypothetical protein